MGQDLIPNTGILWLNPRFEPANVFSLTPALSRWERENLRLPSTKRYNLLTKMGLVAPSPSGRGPG